MRHLLRFTPNTVKKFIKIAYNKIYSDYTNLRRIAESWKH